MFVVFNRQASGLPHKTTPCRNRVDVDGHHPGGLKDPGTPQAPRQSVGCDGIRYLRNGEIACLHGDMRVPYRLRNMYGARTGVSW